MPTRMIRDGILTSPRVDKLDCAAELFYRRLQSIVDDRGRFEANPTLVRSRAFPLRVDKVKDSDVIGWLDECACADLLVLYEVQGKRFLQIKDFDQRLRTLQSSRPAPPEGLTDAVRIPPPASDDVGGAPPEEKRREEKKSFTPPTQDEVVSYVAEKGYTFDPVAFWSFYESKGWVVGKSAMKSWRAACVTWQSKEPGGVTVDPGKAKAENDRILKESESESFRLVHGRDKDPWE